MSDSLESSFNLVQISLIFS